MTLHLMLYEYFVHIEFIDCFKNQVTVTNKACCSLWPWKLD